MKIKSLFIANFLGINRIEMDLSCAPIHIIAGENEAGKSSIRDALQVAITGQARGLHTHEQQASFIRKGAKAADIKIILTDGQAPIIWHKTPKVAATRTGPIPEDAVMLSILADPFVFLSLENKTWREVLFRLLPGLNPTGEMIYKKLADMIPDFDPGSAILHEMATLAAGKGFKAAEAEAITRRRISKRVRDEAKMEDPETQATIGGRLRILPDIQLAEIESGLTALGINRDKLQRIRGKVEAQADKLPELEYALNNLIPAEPPDSGDITRFVEGLKINRGILVKCRAKVAAMTEGTDPQKFPSLCPVFSVGCPSAGKEAVKGTKAKDVDPKALAKAQADLAEQEKEIGLIEADLATVRLAQATYDDYTEQHAALVDKIAKIKEAQEQTVAMSTVDEQIAALDLRIKIGYELLNAVREFWRKKDAANQAADKLAEAEKEIALYDALAKALAPDGIPSGLIAEALGPVNERLAFASGYLFPNNDEHESLHLNGDLEIYRGSTPYALLSKSARYRTGIAFQFALAILSGARIMMIDEGDILDPPNRANLIDFLLAVRQDFDIILVFATSDHADPSPIPELAVWWLDNGKVSPVRAQGAAA